MALRSDIAARVAALRQQLPDTVRLVAVTKQFPAELIRAAYAAGVRDFGESRVQEAAAKQQQLQDLPDITWHLIGHLQTNKVRKAVEIFDWIHSVDSLKLARRLDQAAGELGRYPQGCLQVKLLPDPPKSGFELEELEAALPELSQLEQLELVGLMCIPPLGLAPAETACYFQQCAQLAEQIRQRYHSLALDELSMGMSGDYEIAIATGSTCVRLGTALFGQRPTPA